MRWVPGAVILAALGALAVTGCGQPPRAAGPGTRTASPAAGSATAMPAQPSETETPEPPPPTELPCGLCDGPPRPEIRELPDDRTGGVAWGDTTAASARWRTPMEPNWEVNWDQGVSASGFAGIPNIRVTHLTSGQARVYSLVDGVVLLCSDRSAVLAAGTPLSGLMADQGAPLDCAAQPLTASEQAVFAHVRVTGSYSRYRGPRLDETVFPGVTLPTERPDPLYHSGFVDDAPPARTAEPPTPRAQP